jgi:hypothetical protein
MKIYKAVFDTKEQGTEYLLNIGVLVEQEGENVFAPTTAAVVYIGKVVEIPATYDDEGNIITPAVYYPGFAIDIMVQDSVTLDFGSYAVYPADNSAHSFYGYPRNAEVPPTEQ